MEANDQRTPLYEGPWADRVAPTCRDLCERAKTVAGALLVALPSIHVEDRNRRGADHDGSKQETQDAVGRGPNDQSPIRRHRA